MKNQTTNKAKSVTTLQTKCETCEALKKALIENQKQLLQQRQTLSDWSCLCIH